MWLLIDDVRDLNADAIARTPEAGQRLLASGATVVLWDMDAERLPGTVAAFEAVATGANALGAEGDDGTG